MRKRARRRLRPEQAIGEAATPVFLVSPERRIAFFNSGCEKLTDWPADEVIGQLCEYVADARAGSLESLAASLCPPAEAFGGKTVSVPALVACRNGQAEPRTLNFVPLRDSDGTITAVMGIVAAAADSGKLVATSAAQSLHSELAALRLALARRFGTQSLICRSEGMLRVAGQVAIAKGTGTSVLVWGEKGSGKEHVARAIHYESEGRTRAFVPLDCQRLAPVELEQTLRRLFGPQDDNFDSPGALWPGTIFLVHAERLPRDLQKTIVDSLRSASAAAGTLRLIASTTVDPALLGADDQLRSDFYHLLTHLSIAVPPLRRRPEDLRYLALHLLEESNRGESRQFNGFGDDVWEKFEAYNWPGNVDELLAVILEARAACNEPLIRAKDLPFRFRTGFEAQAIGPVLRPPIAPLEPFLAQAEKEQIERALEQCRHNKSKAAQLLGMTRPRLYRRMEILGIRDEAER